jgi:lipoate-protein ligase A
LSGILVDVERTTCYDLGEEQKALKGQFENQTHLNLPLLKKVLEFSHG